MSEQKSDSSYDAEERPAQTQPVEQTPAPQSCSIQGGSCSCCCSCCPLSKLAPENIEATLQRNASCIEEFQGAIFFRRPIAFAALIVSVNLIFFLYRRLNLSFYAQVCLCGLLYIAYQIIPAAIISKVKSILFPGTLNKGQPNEPNRIRDTNELVAPINTVLAPFFGFVKIVRTLSYDQTVTGQLIYASIFFCLFCFTASVDLFWPIVIFTNLALILPGVLTLPQVVPYIQKAKEHVKTISEPSSHPAQQHPSVDLQGTLNQVQNTVNEGLQQAHQAAQDVANDAKEALHDAANHAQEIADNIPKVHDE